MNLLNWIRKRRQRNEVQVGEPVFVEKFTGQGVFSKEGRLRDVYMSNEKVDVDGYHKTGSYQGIEGFRSNDKPKIGNTMMKKAGKVSKVILRHVSSAASEMPGTSLKRLRSAQVPREEKRISKKKLAHSLYRLGISKKEAKLLTKAVFMMHEHSHSLTQYEIKLAISYLMDLSKKSHPADFGFNFFDLDHDGKISKEEMAGLLAKFLGSNLENLLQTPEARKVFEDFLKYEVTSETHFFAYIFYQLSRRLLTKPHVSLNNSKHICERFMAKGSPFELGLDSDIKDTVYQKVQIYDMQNKKQVDTAIFRTVIEEIKYHLENHILQGFVRSHESTLVDEIWRNFPTGANDLDLDSFLLGRDSFDFSLSDSLDSTSASIDLSEFKGWAGRNKPLLRYLERLQAKLKIASATLHKLEVARY